MFSDLTSIIVHLLYSITTTKVNAKIWEVTMKRIILTGGGTAGHVTPNIALLPRLKELQYDIHYIGSYNGIEKELIEQFGIPYHGIATGKLRRYFSVQNFTDSIPCSQSSWRCKETCQDPKAGRYFLQRWICIRTCCSGW